MASEGRDGAAQGFTGAHCVTTRNCASFSEDGREAGEQRVSHQQQQWHRARPLCCPTHSQAHRRAAFRGQCVSMHSQDTP